MIAIYPSNDLLMEETTWAVWEGGVPVQTGLSLAEAGEAARKLTVKRVFEAMQRRTAAPTEEGRPARRGIYLSKEHKGKWEIWEDGVYVESYDSAEAAAEDFFQNDLKAAAIKAFGMDGT